MYSRIVVGTDGSATACLATEHALALAKQTGAVVHAVTVWRSQPPAAFAAAPFAAMPLSQERPDDWAKEALATLAKRAAEAGVSLETHSVDAAAAGPALVDVAKTVRADLIVVGNRGMKGARGLLRSVPNHVAHHADCAVLVVPTS